MGKRKASKESTGHVEKQCDVWLTATPKPTKKQKVLRDPLSSIKNIVKYEQITVPMATKQTMLTDFFRKPTQLGCPDEKIQNDLDKWSSDYSEQAAPKLALQMDLNQGGIITCHGRRKGHPNEKTLKAAEPTTLISCKQSTFKHQDNRNDWKQDCLQFERTGLKDMMQHGVKVKNRTKEPEVIGKNLWSHVCDKGTASCRRNTCADNNLRLSNSDLSTVDESSQPLNLCGLLGTDSSQRLHILPVTEQGRTQPVSGHRFKNPLDSVSDINSERITHEDQSCPSNTSSELLPENFTQSSSRNIRFVNASQLHINTASLCAQTQNMDMNNRNASIDMPSSSDFGMTSELDTELTSTTNKIRFIDTSRLSEMPLCSQDPENASNKTLSIDSLSSADLGSTCNSLKVRIVDPVLLRAETMDMSLISDPDQSESSLDQDQGESPDSLQFTVDTQGCMVLKRIANDDDVDSDEEDSQMVGL